MTQPLIVDGARPAVEWVSSLPPAWASATQRLVLLVLALDAFEATSSPGESNLLTWCGLNSRSTMYDALRALARPVDGVRPALIERVTSRRARTQYRLLVSGWTGPSDRTSGDPHPYGVPDTKTADTSGDPHLSTSGQPDANLTHTSGHTSGHTSDDESGGPDTPFPSLPSTTHLLTSTTDARAITSRTRPLRPGQQEQRQRELDEDEAARIEAERARQQAALEARIATEKVGEVA